MFSWLIKLVDLQIIKALLEMPHMRFTLAPSQKKNMAKIMANTDNIMDFRKAGSKGVVARIKCDGRVISGNGYQTTAGNTMRSNLLLEAMC
jgi:hypothetical protein